MQKSINRRDVIAKAGAVAGASLVALPAVARAVPQENHTADAESAFSRAFQTFKTVDQEWSRINCEEGDDAADAYHDRVVRAAERGVAATPIESAKDALAAMDYLIEECFRDYGAMVNSMAEGIRAHLKVQVLA